MESHCMACWYMLVESTGVVRSVVLGEEAAQWYMLGRACGTRRGIYAVRESGMS